MSEPPCNAGSLHPHVDVFCSCSLGEVLQGSISDVIQPALGLDRPELDHELQRLGEDCRTAAMRRLETISEWGPRLIYIGVICYIGWRIVSAYAGQMRDVQELMKQ